MSDLFPNHSDFLTGQDFRPNVVDFLCERVAAARYPTCRFRVNSQVGVSEHGVLLPHGAETFDSVNKFFIVHEL